MLGAKAEPNGSRRRLRETKTKREGKGGKKERKEESLLNNVLEKISLKQKTYLLTFLLCVLCGYSKLWLVRPWDA